jgi:endoglucanase
VLLEILKQDWGIPVYGAFVVQEEVGERGSQVAAYAIEPDIGIALEGTLCVDLPGIPEADRVTELGKGPALSIMDRGSIPDRALRQQVESVARENGIPFQYRRSTKGSTDAMMINLAREGCPTLGISTPCRNIHSPVSVACKADFENTVKLMSFFLKSVEGGFRP